MCSNKMIDAMPLVRWRLQIADFAKELLKYEYHLNGLLGAPKALCDTVESLIGAVYPDSKWNQEVVWQVSVSIRIVKPYFFLFLALVWEFNVSFSDNRFLINCLIHYYPRDLREASRKRAIRVLPKEC